jgi:hypothetical protein
MNYEEFLEDKSIVSHEHGLTEIPELHASMFPHQRDVTQWALRLGKSAAFLGTGLGSELKRSYYEQATRNLGNALSESAGLFAGLDMIEEEEDEDLYANVMGVGSEDV